MQITDADATFTPSADLAYGTHTVAYHATDGAGNTRDGSWTFDVVDTTPPSLSHAMPADGSSGEDRRPEVAFDVVDAGIGVDPGSLHVVLDGVDVVAAGSLVAGHFSLVPGANLAYGSHHVKVTVADRSGNAMTPAEWTFRVADVTAPVLTDPTPKNGSSGADRTPAISLQISDDGIGVDPATIAVVDRRQRRLRCGRVRRRTVLVPPGDSARVRRPHHLGPRLGSGGQRLTGARMVVHGRRRAGADRSPVSVRSRAPSSPARRSSRSTSRMREPVLRPARSVSTSTAPTSRPGAR